MREEDSRLENETVRYVDGYFLQRDHIPQLCPREPRHRHASFGQLQDLTKGTGQGRRKNGRMSDLLGSHSPAIVYEDAIGAT
jgi:hypothetical protein